MKSLQFMDYINFFINFYYNINSHLGLNYTLYSMFFEFEKVKACWGSVDLDNSFGNFIALVATNKLSFWCEKQFFAEMADFGQKSNFRAVSFFNGNIKHSLGWFYVREL